MFRSPFDRPSQREGRPSGRLDTGGAASERLAARLGLNVPYEWWPRPAALKAIEAAGFAWVQVASPPVEMLAEPGHARRHAQALRRSLEVTGLNTIVHGPTSLRLGSSLHDRAFRGLLEYADGLGAGHVVYHALDLPARGNESEREERSLRSMARPAEELGVTICLENLSPVYPGSRAISHHPEAVRDLVLRLNSPSVRMLLDLGHANIVADGEGTDLDALIEPVLHVVSLFHVHDNFGMRRQATDDLVFDPLRLDLHLPPGEGTLPWQRIAPALVAHEAPLMLEVHPSHRPGARMLYEVTEATLLQRSDSSSVPLEELSGSLV
jgi:sugar phosphate isomerase/epimerase